MNALSTEVKTPNQNIVPVSGMVILPKLNCVGVYKVTAIDPNDISGTEPTTIDYKGKKYDGTKIYTKAGGFFKVFASVPAVLKAQFDAKRGVAFAAVKGMVALPEYDKETKELTA